MNMKKCALLLMVAGLYGVLSYMVVRRRREIGVRIAFGANAQEVLKLVMFQGWKLTLAGIVVGWIASIVLTRTIEGLLFDITATDPLTFGFAIVVLSLSASLACWIPARRAMQVDPIIALRCQ